MLDKGFHQGITRKYALVPQHRRKFPALFHLKPRFEPGGPVHYLILKKKYITVLPQVLNRIYSFNFQLHFKFHRFSRQFTTVFPGSLAMDKQVDVLYRFALSVDISHISHNSHNSRVTWIQHALRALSQIDRFHRSSDAQTTSLQSYTTIKDTFVGAGFPRPTTNADTSLAYLFLRHYTHVLPRSNSNSNSFSYLYPHQYTGDQDTAFPIFQGSTLTGIERETFEIVQKLLSKLHFDHTHSNDRNMTFIKGVGNTQSLANISFPGSNVGQGSVLRGGVVFNAPQPFLRSGEGIRIALLPIPVEKKTTAISIEKKSFTLIPGSKSKSHTDHTHSNDRYSTFITSVGGMWNRWNRWNWANTRFAPTFTYNPASIVGDRSDFVFALMHGGTAGYPIPAAEAGTNVFEKEKFQKEKYQMVQEIISKSHSEHTPSNDRYITFITSVGGTWNRWNRWNWANTRFAPTFTYSPASFVGDRSDFVFALMHGGTVGYPIPAPAAGKTVLKRTTALNSISNRDQTLSKYQYTTLKTGVDAVIRWPNMWLAESSARRGGVNYNAPTVTPEQHGNESQYPVGDRMCRGVILNALSIAPRFPRSIVFSLSRTTAHAPVLSTAKSEFFQTLTKRMDTTLRTLQNRQSSELTTLHFTSGTNGASGTPGKTGPKPVNLPQLDYFTPVGTIQPKTESSLAEREETTVSTHRTGLMGNTVTDHSAAGKIPAIPGIDSAAVSGPQEGTIDFDRLTDRVYRMLESKITMEKEMRGW
jgi:hypothetical protein